MSIYTQLCTKQIFPKICSTVAKTGGLFLGCRCPLYAFTSQNVNMTVRLLYRCSKPPSRIRMWKSQIRTPMNKKICSQSGIIGTVSRFGLTLTGLGFSQYCFVSPFAFFRRDNKSSETQLSTEIISNIPKEVFKKHTAPKKRKRNFIMRIFYWIWTEIRFTFRFFRLFLTFAPIICTYPVVSISDCLMWYWWRWILWACEFTGPTFIKLGQWASTRRDLFPDEFCDMFSKLHNSTHQHSWYITKHKLRKAFGKRWREILVKVEKEPLGSGCIAQVHKAYIAKDMIPDESLVEEVVNTLTETDDDEMNEVDFAEGLEVAGFGKVLDQKDSFDEYFERCLGSQSSSTSNIESSYQAEPEQQSELSEAYPKPGVPPPEMESLLPVAVKVLHPGVYKATLRDLEIIRAVASLAEKCFPGLRWLSLTDCVNEFSDMMLKQIDLRFEAECLEQFAEHFAEVPNIRFPRPIWPYLKWDVLVETYEEGEPISNFLNEENETAFPTGLKEALAGYGVDALLQMIFLDNMTHGDLHPGNILVQNAKDYENTDENKMILVDVCDTVVVNVKPVENPVRLVLLDAGITVSLSENDLNNFKAVFTAVVIGEGEAVAELMLKHASYNECKDVDSFKKELGDIVMNARANTIKLGKIQVGELLSKVFSVLCKHHVKMESNFASILLALFVLEGIGRSLDPELDILERAKPILLH